MFSDCSLWNATPFDLMLAGTRNASGPGSVAAFAQPWRLPALRARLEEIGLELPQQIGATFLGDAAYLNELTADTPPLVDDRPRRLRPDPHSPSLSDPGYGSDPRVTKLYDSVLESRTSARWADDFRLHAPPLARGADRRGGAVVRPPARPEPGDVGRRPGRWRRSRTCTRL